MLNFTIINKINGCFLNFFTSFGKRVYYIATIIIGSFMVRYPLGGNLSWALQYLTGFKELGHEVYLVEKYGYVNSCYDPIQQIESDDCSYGVKVVSELFSRYGLDK